MQAPALADPVVLFSGQLDTQRVSVMLMEEREGICIYSSDVGPKLERYFGQTEMETYLIVGPGHYAALATALGVAVDQVMPELAKRYMGDSAATSHWRQFLGDHDIPHEFHLV